MQCTNCSNEVEPHLRYCSTCGEDCGFPNVRMAENKSETLALDKRYKDAFTSANAAGHNANLTDFEAAVAKSFAVIARPISTILSLFENDKNTYVSFQRQVEAGIRHPEDNEFDKVREAYESALYPYFGKQIIFASLSLSGHGMSGYGSHSMVLKDIAIANRATVFEENPHLFSEKHSLLKHKPIPEGYRASWASRGRLAVAKLHSSINSETTADRFENVLQEDNGGSGNSDWIEVHIFGELTRRSFERIVGPEPKLRADKAIWNSLKRKAKTVGVEVELL